MILPSPRAIRTAALLTLGSLTGALLPAVGWAFAMGLVCLAAAVLLEGRSLPREAVACRRHVPPRFSLHEPETITEELDSLCNYPLEVRVAEASQEDLNIQPSFSPVVRLPAHGRVEVQFKAVASRRGEGHLLRPTLRFGRIGGLALRQIPVGSPLELRVFPNLARLKRYDVLRQARALANIGIHRTRYGGLGSEFDHLRAYSRDDDYRRIHWKATARRGSPITQVFQAERGQSVIIAVDCSHWMGISAGDLSRLDYAVDAALFLAHVAHSAGDRVGLALFANEVLQFLMPSSKPGQIRRVLEVLYSAHPHAMHPSYRNLARHLLARRLRRSLVVVLTEPTDPEAAAELLAAMAALQPRHLPLSVGLRDPALVALAEAMPENLDDLCRRLAAREAIEEREQRLREQRKKGLKVLDVLPENLSVALVNRYLELKNQGAI